MHRFLNFLNFLCVCKSVTRPRFIPFGRLTGNVGSSIKGHIGQALTAKVNVSLKVIMLAGGVMPMSSYLSINSDQWSDAVPFSMASIRSRVFMLITSL